MGASVTKMETHFWETCFHSANNDPAKIRQVFPPIAVGNTRGWKKQWGGTSLSERDILIFLVYLVHQNTHHPGGVFFTIDKLLSPKKFNIAKQCLIHSLICNKSGIVQMPYSTILAIFSSTYLLQCRTRTTTTSLWLKIRDLNFYLKKLISLGATRALWELSGSSLQLRVSS